MFTTTIYLAPMTALVVSKLLCTGSRLPSPNIARELTTEVIGEDDN